MAGLNPVRTRAAANGKPQQSIVVRFIGLTSRSWPRRFGEDPILPDHIVRSAELDSDPPAEADLRAYRVITASTARSIVLSRHRRSAQGSRVTAGPLFISAGQAEQMLAGGVSRIMP